MHLAGNEDYDEITEDARLEDRTHFELVAPRVYGLEGKLPNDIRDFADRASCQDAELPDNPRPVNILGVLLEAERCAIRTRSEVCGTTEGGRSVHLRHGPADPPGGDRIRGEVRQTPLEGARQRSQPRGHFVRGEPVDAPLSTNRRFNDSA